MRKTLDSMNCGNRSKTMSDWFSESRLDPNYGYYKPCDSRRYDDVLSYAEVVRKAVEKIEQQKEE
jgi:hypothetical protein